MWNKSSISSWFYWLMLKPYPHLTLPVKAKRCCLSALSVVRTKRRAPNITVSPLTGVNVSPHLTFSVLNFSSHGNLHQWHQMIIHHLIACCLFPIVFSLCPGVRNSTGSATFTTPFPCGLQQVAAALFDLRLFRLHERIFFLTLSQLKISQIYMKPWLRCGIYNNRKQLSSNVPLPWGPCGHFFSLTHRHKSQSK